MNDINKDELLDLNKWKRFFFMVIYSFAINGVVGILIIIAAVQFFIYLFTSKINNQLQSANNWLHGFFSDSLNFLSLILKPNLGLSMIRLKHQTQTKMLKLSMVSQRTSS